MKDKIFNLAPGFVLGVGGVFVMAVIGYVMAYLGIIGYVIVPLIFLTLILGYYIFKNPYLGFLLIIFFLPFERIPTLLVGGVDIRINTILGFITLLAWILASMFNGKRWKIQPNALAWPITLFVIALMLSLTQALNFERGLQVIVFSLFTIALSIMTVNMLPDKSALQKTIVVLFLSSVIVSIFGLFQFGGDVIGLPASVTLLKEGYTSAVFGFPRIQAFSMEPLYFANYLIIPLSLALAYFLARVDVVKRWWIIGIVSLLLLNFVLTVSRGGYLGLIATVLILAIFYYKRIFNWRNLVLVAVLFIVAYGVIFALSKGEYRATNAFIAQATLQDAKKGSESVQGRLSTFEIAFTAFQKHPVFGIGIGNYGAYFKNYPPVTPKTGWDIVNNEFIEILAETGLVGAIAYGLILIVLIWRSLLALKYARDPLLRATMIGLFAAFIGVMIQYNFFSTLYIIHIWVLIGLLVGVQNLIFREKTDS